VNIKQINNQSTVVQQIISEIKDNLIKGYLEPGERLPPESKLVELFGVSRTAVREAMKILAAIGVVEIRRGDGTYIATDSISNALNPLEFALIIGKKSSSDLLELRKILDLGCCEFVIKKANEEDIKILTELAKEYKTLVESCAPIAVILEKDIELHKTFIQTTKNEPLIIVSHTVIALFTESMLKALSKPNVAFEGIRQHMAIVESIKARDIVGLREHMEDHLSIWHSSSVEQ